MGLSSFRGTQSRSIVKWDFQLSRHSYYACTENRETYFWRGENISRFIETRIRTLHYASYFSLADIAER